MRRTGDDLGHPGFGYQPALDGVRGVAVALVLLFHAGFGWMTGGYVGVSVFFTLSGYLITSLAVVEHDRGGRLDVGAFYARRIRRLVPASLLCVLGVLIMASLGAFGPVEGLRRGVWGALFQVYNWVALSAGHSRRAGRQQHAGAGPDDRARGGRTGHHPRGNRARQSTAGGRHTGAAGARSRRG